MDLQTTVRQNMVDYLVGRTLTCPSTGEILDRRTVVVFDDADGDPTAVMSQQGWANVLQRNPDVLEQLAKVNCFLDESTVKEA